MFTEHIILTSLFTKRQRNKDKTTDMRKVKASLWLLALDSELFPSQLLLTGETFNSLILDTGTKYFFGLKIYKLDVVA